jgi:tRNA pseudouridine55 synthase
MRHGFLLIDKPRGPTSHGAVAAVRKTLGERDVGHLGTLDPAASGLLVLAVGAKALKVIEFFSGLGKEYVADIRFGAVSTTYDGEGTIEAVAVKPGWTEPDKGQVQRTIEQRFTGKIEQVPPSHSAVHVAGVRAYDLARKGIAVDMPKRTVEIGACSVLSYDYPHLRLNVRVSSGTYIRSLAHDLGDVLRCGGYLENLRRTKVGEWDVEKAVTPDAATWTDVLPLKDVLAGLPRIDVTAEEAEHLRHGRKIKREVSAGTWAWFDGLPLAVLVPAKDGNQMAQPRKVL